MEELIKDLAQQLKEEYGIEGDIRGGLEQAIRSFAVGVKKEQKDKLIKKELESFINKYGQSTVEDIYGKVIRERDNDLSY